MSGTNRIQSKRSDESERDRSGPQPPAPERWDDGSPTDRGQTTLDFAIGVAIFLSAMTFTFAFAPGIISPFTESDQQNTVTVDRVADRVGQDILGGPDEPYVLDRSCTVAFFDRRDPSQCRWESGSLNEQIGVGEFVDVNVTITGNVTDDPGSSLVHWDEDEGEFTEIAADGDVALAVGDTPPGRNDATVAAERVASLHGYDVTITVVVW